MMKTDRLYNFIAFDDKLPVFADEGLLKISDIKGSTITSFKLNAKQGQRVWDIRNIEIRCIFLHIKSR